MVDVGLLLLALEDFLPVVLSGLSLWVLGTLGLGLDRRSGSYILASMVLIAGGGLTKPIYKTLLALSGGSVDVRILDEMLFWFLAPGFVLLTGGVRGSARADGGQAAEIGRAGAVVAAGVVVVAGLVAVGGSVAWFLVLLGVATFGNLLAVIELIRWARARNEPVAAVLFGASLAIVFGLAWAAASQGVKARVVMPHCDRS